MGQQQQEMTSFGFDHALQMKPAAAAFLEQHMCQDSEALLESQQSYAFSSTNDNFNNLVSL